MNSNFLFWKDETAPLRNLVKWYWLFQTKKYGFGSSFLKSSPLPALYQWLWQAKAALVSKFSLYFHETLAAQSSPAEMKALISRQGQACDYVSKYVWACKSLSLTRNLRNFLSWGCLMLPRIFSFQFIHTMNKWLSLHPCEFMIHKLRNSRNFKHPSHLQDPEFSAQNWCCKCVSGVGGWRTGGISGSRLPPPQSASHHTKGTRQLPYHLHLSPGLLPPSLCPTWEYLKMPTEASWVEKLYIRTAGLMVDWRATPS